MCEEHTQTLKSDRFAADWVWNLSEILSFLKGVKIKVVFVSGWLSTISLLTPLPCLGEANKMGQVSVYPHFCLTNLPSKFLPDWLALRGGRSENAGKFLSSPNGLFGFLPTFHPQKSSILTEVTGEDKKTLTVFSSLRKIQIRSGKRKCARYTLVRHTYISLFPFGCFRAETIINRGNRLLQATSSRCAISRTLTFCRKQTKFFKRLLTK